MNVMIKYNAGTAFDNIANDKKIGTRNQKKNFSFLIAKIKQMKEISEKKEE